MSIAGFIPEIWAARLLTSLKKSLVYGGVANRNYEGEIRNAGDTVTITSISRPTVKNYVRGGTIVREPLTDAQRKLLITEEKYFAFDVDDIDARQAAGNVMPEGMDESAYALRDVADQFVAGLYTGVVSGNDLGTVAVTTAANAYDTLVDLGVKLDEADVPSEGRWAVIPPWFHGLLLKDDRFVGTGGDEAEARLRNGMVGEAAGFSIRKSNNVPNPAGDDYVVQAGYGGTLSFAEQINKVEAFRPEDSFADAVKGLHVYGAKLIRPSGMAIVSASKT